LLFIAALQVFSHAEVGENAKNA